MMHSQSAGIRAVKSVARLYNFLVWQLAVLKTASHAPRHVEVQGVLSATLKYLLLSIDNTCTYTNTHILIIIQWPWTSSY